MTRNLKPSEDGLARRTILKGVGIGVGLVSGFAPSQAQVVTPAATAGGDIWSSEYWANKGGVKLNLWRKRVGAPNAGEQPLPILFLVHGSSNSTRSSFDLNVPGKGEYSLMNVMARYGYDVWTMTATATRAAPATTPTSPAASKTSKQRSRWRCGKPGKPGCISTARRQVRSGPPPTPQRSPSVWTGWCWSPTPTRAPARRKSKLGRGGSSSCAPAIGASAMLI